MSSRTLAAAVAVVACAGLACRAVASDGPVPPGAEDDLRRTAVVKAVEAVSPAVVNIATDRFIPREGFPSLEDLLRGRPRRWKENRRSLGSGVIIDPRGFLLTNAHVVAQGDTIHVKFRPANGVEDPKDEGLLAKAVATDARTDLALLKIQADGPFPFVEMGSSHDLLIGEPAIAIGNPFGFSSTVTAGVVSAVNRTVEFPAGPVEGFIQTDASIDPGNSGGPLLNIRGRLIGLNTAVFREARNIGFAIPVDRIKSALGSLLDPVRSNQTWTGFEVGNRGRELVVDRVVEGSPAAAAGLRVGDVVLDVGGAAPSSVLEFKTALLKADSGQKVALRVRRGAAAVQAVHVAPAEHPAVALLRARLGVEIEPLETRNESGTSEVRFRVREILKGSAADRIGMKAGDVLFALAGTALGNADDIESVLRDVPKETLVPIRVFRQTARGWDWRDVDVSLD
jgi:serine protease Do